MCFNMDNETKLFVGGLPWGTEKDDMKNHFSKYGEVVSCTIAKDRFSGNARGFGFVTFTLPAAAKEALNDTHHINGKLVL
ncbi:hypothetical protein LIER_39414 [Lithospermum erythrorhizon]|uniref:RRM domain-containing protein n=1 Tax=Lithospermum erythrorhizon TaxID=34254 RepID=A0AAV3QFA6_LITER